MNNFQTNYHSLENDDAELQAESVIVHTASEGSKSRWNHIDNLDTFFEKVYTFHQKNGYRCIWAEETTVLLFFGMLGLLLVYATNCIYFNFDEWPSPIANKTDVQLSDLFIPVAKCAGGFGLGTWFFIVLLVLALVIKLIFYVKTLYSYMEMEQFYETAMKIPKSELHNVTWHEVQCKLRDVQHEQQMCVHKSDLTELDIYHRLLRRKNYMVALINKNILPLKYNVKFFGEWIYFPSALEFNINLLLFGSKIFGSPFKETGTLKEEFKKYSKRNEAAKQLHKTILLFGILNLICSPFIFVWQFFIFFMQYAGNLRYEPSFLSTRRWSPYSRLYLRHFNELDHELYARLCRAYKPAKEYLKSFTNPLGTIIHNFLKQIVGSVVVFFFLWGVFKEKIWLLDHVLLIITVGSFLYYGLSALVPDENAVYYPHHLMHRIIADIHYVPDHFKTLAHTTNVRDEFCNLFQYKMVYLFEELMSPLVTPYILLFHLRHRALDIVDFFRCFTVDVAGVGDVCSFALMDVSKHGNQQWVGPGHTKADQVTQAEDGKTELSLIHFKMMNPNWLPPDPSNRFIENLQEQVINARAAFGQRNAFYSSLNSLSTMGSRYASLVNSVHQSIHPQAGDTSMTMTTLNRGLSRMHGGLSHAEGPPYLVQDGFSSLTTNEVDVQAMQDFNPMEVRAADMSLSALFLHEVHDNFITSPRVQASQAQNIHHHDENNGNEEAPLLDIRRPYAN